ncbi:MFS transporter [Pectobacterium carotovorum]|nr:MFS transporter [Pectobacterium carotovorum]
MDALAVSVVTPERVGMATGIFNTVRVSADGVAIAMMSALLATLIQNGMALEMWESVSQAALLEAASRTALGELHTAVSILPGYEALLSQRYAESFISVMYVLAGIAALTACAVFVLLREQPADASTEQQT